jgi:MFS family permease
MRGRYQGVFGFSFAAAALVAPLLGGFVYDALGSNALWLGCGAVGLVTALGHLLIAPARRARLAELAEPAAAAGSKL